MNKSQKKITILIIFIITILMIGVGYAYFSETLVITGTSKIVGTFDIQFKEARIENPTELETINITQDGKNLNFQVNLTMPGESDTIYYTIVNNGTIDATLENLVITSNQDNDVTFNPSNISGDLISGDTINGSITVTWNANSYSAQKDVSFNAYIKATQKK